MEDTTVQSVYPPGSFQHSYIGDPVDNPPNRPPTRQTVADSAVGSDPGGRHIQSDFGYNYQRLEDVDPEVFLPRPPDTENNYYSLSDRERHHYQYYPSSAHETNYTRLLPDIAHRRRVARALGRMVY